MKRSKTSEEKISYKVVIEPAVSVFKEKASKFISLIYPIKDLDDAELIRKKVAKEYFNATHHCYGLRIGFKDNLVEKSSDAGEPNHTAGEPILNALRHHNITNSILVVVRYFGGTKLGTGGLIRAYHHSAMAVIEAAKLKEIYQTVNLILETPFQGEGIIRYSVSKLKGKISKEKRGFNGIKMEVELPIHQKEIFEKNLKEQKEKWKNELIWKWK